MNRMKWNSSLLFVFVAQLITLELKGSTHKIPFRYVQSFIVLELKLENILPVKMIFDTGAEHNLFFNRKYTDIIQDSYLREVKILGSDLTQEIPALLTSSLSVHFGENKTWNMQFLVLMEPNNSLNEIIGEQIDGILSAAVFSNYIFEIDYKHRQIMLYDKLPSSKKLTHYQICDLLIYKNKPFVKTELMVNSNSNINPLTLLLDTGAGLTLLIYKSAQSTLDIPSTLVPGKLGTGIGGLLNGYIAKSEKLIFCNTDFLNLMTNYLEIHTDYALKESQYKQGLVGNQILDKYSIIFDYNQSKLYWKKLKRDVEFNYDRSGISLIAGGENLNKFVVAYLIPGSTAEVAGLKTGDQILKINGIPASWLSLNSIQRKLSQKGHKKISLKLKRANEKLKIEFNLKDIL